MRFSGVFFQLFSQTANVYIHGADITAVFISPNSIQQSFSGIDTVGISHQEFNHIEFLMRNPNRVYSREALLDTIWAYEYRSDIRTVDVHIRRLREKLEENPAEPKYILTKWGVGYYFKK